MKSGLDIHHCHPLRTSCWILRSVRMTGLDYPMKRLSLAFLIPLLAIAADDPPHPFKGKIERLDPAFDKLVAADAKIEVLAEGFRWSEGPTWLDGGVVFSD